MEPQPPYVEYVPESPYDNDCIIIFPPPYTTAAYYQAEQRVADCSNLEYVPPKFLDPSDYLFLQGFLLRVR